MFSIYRTPQRMEDLALFSRHLAGAMRAHVPLPEILRAYLHDAETGTLARAVETLAHRAEEGVPLSAGMEEFPKVFPKSYRRMVLLGEQGRTLAGVMEQLADQLEDALKTYEYLRRIAIYPLIVMLILFLMVTFLNMKIMPKLYDIFSQMGAVYESLGAEDSIGLATLLTRLGRDPHIFSWMMLAMDLLNLVLLIPIIFLIANALGLRVRGFGAGRLTLMIPLIGPVYRQTEIAQFANLLSMLLRNRIPLSDALGLLTDASTNSYVRSAIHDFHQRYEKGEKLGDIIAHQPLFPASMAVMVASAEDQGALADTLSHLGRFYRQRTQHSFDVVCGIFEPMLMMLVGLVVAAIALGLYLPLFSIPKVVK